MNLQTIFHLPNLFTLTLFLYTRIIFCAFMSKIQNMFLVCFILKHIDLGFMTINDNKI